MTAPHCATSTMAQNVLALALLGYPRKVILHEIDGSRSIVPKLEVDPPDPMGGDVRRLFRRANHDEHHDIWLHDRRCFGRNGRNGRRRRRWWNGGHGRDDGLQTGHNGPLLFRPARDLGRWYVQGGNTRMQCGRHSVWRMRRGSLASIRNMRHDHDRRKLRWQTWV